MAGRNRKGVKFTWRLTGQRDVYNEPRNNVSPKKAAPKRRVSYRAEESETDLTQVQLTLIDMFIESKQVSSENIKFLKSLPRVAKIALIGKAQMSPDPIAYLNKLIDEMKNRRR